MIRYTLLLIYLLLNCCNKKENNKLDVYTKYRELKSNISFYCIDDSFTKKGYPIIKQDYIGKYSEHTGVIDDSVKIYLVTHGYQDYMGTKPFDKKHHKKDYLMLDNRMIDLDSLFKIDKRISNTYHILKKCTFNINKVKYIIVFISSFNTNSSHEIFFPILFKIYEKKVVSFILLPMRTDTQENCISSYKDTLYYIHRNKERFSTKDTLFIYKIEKENYLNKVGVLLSKNDSINLSKSRYLSHFSEVYLK